MLTKLATFSGVSPQTGEPLVQMFRQGASVEKTAGQMSPDIKDWLSTYKSDKENVPLLVNAMGDSRIWGQNRNGDNFFWPALSHDCRCHDPSKHSIDKFTGKRIPAHGYWTFLMAHPFVHHKNKDPGRAFGKVAVSTLNPLMKRVELVVLINRQRAEQYEAGEFVARIDQGEFPDVSMGTKIPYDTCLICGNKSRTKKDYCECLKKWRMGAILPDGRIVGVDNPHPRFFDISFVFIGADKTAKVMTKLASDSGLWVPESVVDAERLYGPEESLVKTAGVGMTNEDFLRFFMGSKAAKKGVGRSLGTHGRTDEAIDKDEPSRNEGVLPTNYTEHDTVVSNEAREKEAAAKLQAPPHRDRYPYAGRMKFRGMTINIENAKGTWRTGEGWKTFMKFPYGEIDGSMGSDGDPVDAYIGPDASVENVYIVHQNHVAGPNKGTYDEDKCMLGFKTAKQAEKAYKGQYTGVDPFRSITTMKVDAFKKLVFSKEGVGEKLAGCAEDPCSGAPDTAGDVLDEYFNYGNRRRHRRFTDKVTNESTTHVGSGLGDTFEDDGAVRMKTKTAGVKDAAWKLAEIKKVIPADKVMPKVVEKLDAREKDIPKDILDILGKLPLPVSLSTPSAMGIVLRPKEFQRVVLVRMGKGDVADKLDSDCSCFKEGDGKLPLTGGLGYPAFSAALMRMLLPFLENRSFIEPVLKRRIIRISVTAPEKKEEKDADSPLLTKISSAYNWYRSECLSAAKHAPYAIKEHPELQLAVLGPMADDFTKNASAQEAAMGAAIASIPIALMYASSLKRAKNQGQAMGAIKSFIADHPKLTAMGTSVMARELMEHPAVNKAVSDVASRSLKSVARFVAQAAGA